MAFLQYDFRAVGVANVERAIAGIERRAIASMNRVARHGGASSPRRAGASGTGGVNRSGGGSRGMDAHVRARSAFLRKQESEEIRSAKRIADARIREERRASRVAERERAKTARQQVANRQRVARGTVGVAGRSVGGMVGGVGRMGGSLLAIGGGFAVAGAIGKEKALRGSSRALANQAFNTPGEKRSREQINAAVQAVARKEGIRSGLGSEGMISGMRQFTEISGKLGGAEKLAPLMADIANATDADIGDVGRTGGQILQSLGTKYDLSKQDEMNKAMQETESIMLAMAGQAKVGSIEFKDMSQQMGKLMSATAGFDGSASDLAKTMGAIAQISIAGGASSPEEAMTSIMRFRDDLVANQKRFAKSGKIGGKGGVNVFADEGKTKLRGPEEILFDMLKSTKGSLPEVGRLFGKRAQKAVQPFQAAFTKAGGGEKGLASVRRLLDSVKGASIDKAELRESAAFKTGGEDRQFDIAMAKFNDAMGKELLPTVTKLVPEFVKLIPKMVEAAEAVTKFINALLDKPISTIGTVIAAKLVADLAAAGIGTVVKEQFIKMLAGSRVPLPGAPGAIPVGGGGPGVVPVGGAPKSMLGRAGGFIKGFGGAAAMASLPAALITAVGQMGVRAVDEQIGGKTKVASMFAGNDEKGEWSLSQQLTDMIPIYGQVMAGKRAGEAAKNLGQEAGVFRQTADSAGPQIKKIEGGKALVAAAAKLSQAADKLSSSDANRGNKPSPVK